MALVTSGVAVYAHRVADFRFENLEVWKMATEIGHRLVEAAEDVSNKGQEVFSKRLQEASWWISGILAEGSSCPSKPEFAVYVARARAATMEVANLVIFFGNRELISEEDEETLVNMLKREAKMLDNFRQSLERAGLEQADGQQQNHQPKQQRPQQAQQQEPASDEQSSSPAEVG